MPLANPKTNPDLKIFLVGFMGTGKTTLGRLLAERIGWVFFDLDALMEEVEGATIMRIFIEKGEPYFRALESSTIARLAAHPGHAVIASGGGTFRTPQHQAVMLQRGHCLDRPAVRPGLAAARRAGPPQALAARRAGVPGALRAARSLLSPCQ